jgi:micrococcal nuclease
MNKTLFFFFLCFNIYPQSFRIVYRVIDGDTVELDGGERVRLIGIDTPEIRDHRPEVAAMALQAKVFLRGVAEGKKVRVEFDQRKKDKYGRTLAYLYLEDGTFINASMVKEGFSAALTKYPFKFMEDFRGYERQAREAGKGLWAAKN